MKLSNFTHGRDNNFNLIRMVAALAVLVTHCFALARGSGDAEPLRETLGMTMGLIAVDIFFIASGFLVTASLLSRESVVDFFWARALRIFPALLVMLLLTVFGLGLFFSSLPPSSYLANSKTYVYLAKSATMFRGAGEYLPGVFDSNPFRGAVNGSLWTLPHEMRMYVILAIVWAALRLSKRNSARLFHLGIVTIAVASGILVVARHFYSPVPPRLFMQLFYMFFAGASFYILKDRIMLSRKLFWCFVIVLLVSALINKHTFFVFYLLTIPYILFYVAYVPSGYLRKYNHVGDYSYGTYIYAFPVQQSVAALIPGVSVLSMLLISVPATFLLAVLSWHLLERRALELKTLYIGHTRRILSYGLRGTSV